MSVFADVNVWMESAGQTEAPCDRLTALYIGLQCEEFAEKLEVLGFRGASTILQDLGNDIKAGVHDERVFRAFRSYEDSIKLLDADMDLIWVTAGAANAQWCDSEGAWEELVKSNYSKFKDGQAIKDKNGKIVKPDTYIAPDFSKYI